MIVGYFVNLAPGLRLWDNVKGQTIAIALGRPVAGAHRRWWVCWTRWSLWAGWLRLTDETVAGRQSQGSRDDGRGGLRERRSAAVSAAATLGSVSAAQCWDCSASDVPRISTFISGTYVVYGSNAIPIRLDRNIHHLNSQKNSNQR